MFKKILLAVLVALPSYAASAQTFKMGIVDTNSVVEAMPETKEAETKLAGVSKQYEDEYQKLGEEMKRMYEEYQKAMDEKKPQAIIESKARDLQQMQTKVQNFEQSAQQDLSNQQTQLMQPIFLKIKSAVESVAKEGAFSLVESYNPQLTLYHAEPVVDITPLVKAKLGLK